MDSQKSSLKIGRQIQDYITSHQLRYGYAPGFQLLQGAFPEVSAAVINAHLNHLARSGVLVDEEDKEAISRGSSAMTLVTPSIPVQGCRIKTVDRPKHHLGSGSLAFNLAGTGHASPPESYAIQVPDDMMIGANLAKGDYAILAPAPMRSGDIVAAVLGGALVLRRYVVITDIPHLMAENPTTPELVPAYNAVIQGVLWASLRIEPCNERLNQQKIRKVDYTKPFGSKLLRKQSRSSKSSGIAGSLNRHSSEGVKGLYLDIIQPSVKFCVNEQPADSAQKSERRQPLDKASKFARKSRSK